eukprot:2749348-Alexandrium_andersonii.AAC.1
MAIAVVARQHWHSTMLLLLPRLRHSRPELPACAKTHGTQRCAVLRALRRAARVQRLVLCALGAAACFASLALV